MAKIVDWSGHIGRRLRLRDLHVFAAVVQLGSMAKAAAQLHVTQPAVSQVIADLESALGVSLLDRSPRGVTPTVYGEALLKGGSAAFDDLKQAIKEIEFLADPTSGEVRIGCPETVAVLITPVIERLSRKHPGIVLHVSEVVAPTLDIPRLRDRTLDLALVRVAGSPSAHRYGDDLDAEVLLNDDAKIVVGKDSPWSRRRKIDLAELAGERWILPPVGSLNHTLVLEAFAERGLGVPKVSLVTYSMQLRANLVAGQRYVTIFPQSLMRLFADSMRLKVLPIVLPSKEWPIAMLTLKHRMLNPVARIFIAEMRHTFNELAGPLDGRGGKRARECAEDPSGDPHFAPPIC